MPKTQKRNSIGLKKKKTEKRLKQIQILDEIRKKLTTLDFSVEDCYNILKGYMNYQMKQQNNSAEETPTEVS